MSTETDAPVTNVTQPAQEVVTQPQAETPPWEQKTTENTAAQDDKQQATAQEPDWYVKKIGKMTARYKTLEAQHQQMLNILQQQTQGKQQTEQPRQQQATPEKSTEKPNIEQFQKYEDYLDALTEWKADRIYEAREKAKQERTEKEQGEARQRETVEQQRRAVVEQQATLNKLTAEAEKKYPDFYEKVFDNSGRVPISNVVGQSILESEQGTDVAYHLGTHPEEAQRIFKLSPAAQLREFGKLEVSLAKQQSTAPAPINPIAGRQAGSDAPSANDDMKSWIAKRNRQLGRK